MGDKNVTRRVVFHYKYPNNSALQLRIVEVKEGPDARHVLELSDDVDAMGERRWRYPEAGEHETNANRLTTLLALAVDQLAEGKKPR